MSWRKNVSILGAAVSSVLFRVHHSFIFIEHSVSESFEVVLLQVTLSHNVSVCDFRSAKGVIDRQLGRTREAHTIALTICTQAPELRPKSLPTSSVSVGSITVNRPPEIAK